MSPNYFKVFLHVSLITLCGAVATVDTLEPGLWVELVWLSSYNKREKQLKLMLKITNQIIPE